MSTLQFDASLISDVVESARFAKRRVDTVDYAKGLGILLVVVAHVWRGLENANIAVPAAISDGGMVDRWIYGFHMPLFFFASGLFLFRSAGKSATEFFFEKAAGIAWPFVVWTIVYWMLGVATRHDGLMDSLVHTVRGMHLWFLRSLFMLVLIVLIFRTLRLPAWSLLGAALLINVAVRNGLALPFGFYQLAMFLPYVAGGAAVGPYALKAFERAPLGAWAIVLAISTPIVTAAAIDGAVSEPMYGPRAGWAGIAMVFAAARFIEAAGVRVIRFLGSVSLEIYLVHIAAAAVARMVLLKLHVTGWPLHLAVGTMVAILVPIAVWFAGRALGIEALFRARKPHLIPKNAVAA